MTVRPLRDSDIPVLREMYEKQGFSYNFPDLRGNLIEFVLVVVNESDRPLCAVVAERTVQLYFLAGDFGPPHARMHAIRLLHDAGTTTLKAKGYNQVDAFVPPQIDGKFGRLLERRFGWVRNWKSWCFRF